MDKLTFTTYGIRDPRTEQFVYVGQTFDFKKRKLAHFRNAKKNPRNKGKSIKRWFFEALLIGIEPEFVELEIVETEEQSLISELFWVKKLRLKQHPLLNLWKIHRKTSPLMDVDDAGLMEIAQAAINPYLLNRKPIKTKKRSAGSSLPKDKSERKPKAKKHNKNNSKYDQVSTSSDRKGKAWLPEEDKVLLAFYAEGKGGCEIAELMRRPLNGICARLVRLGIVAERRDVIR